MKPTLVVMAAGMGNRFGGLKQMVPVGPNGELILDYSIYDSILAGFGKVVFVIKKEMEQLFRDMVGERLKAHIAVEYAFQDISDLPRGFALPEGRVKPWGTAHAVMSCRHIVNEPFAAINADDFYGRTSFTALSSFLKNAYETNSTYRYALVGFILKNTLTENGHVARGVCEVDDEDFLTKVVEHTRIEKSEAHGGAKYTEDGVNWLPLSGDATVSLNTWGFTPEIFSEIERGFPVFFQKNADNILKAEYFLPAAVDTLIVEGKARVKVLRMHERWYGMTYKEDLEHVINAVRNMIAEKIYPEKLW